MGRNSLGAEDPAASDLSRSLPFTSDNPGRRRRGAKQGFKLESHASTPSSRRAQVTVDRSSKGDESILNRTNVVKNRVQCGLPGVEFEQGNGLISTTKDFPVLPAIHRLISPAAWQWARHGRKGGGDASIVVVSPITLFRTQFAPMMPEKK
jgi:hypothetical protein